MVWKLVGSPIPAGEHSDADTRAGAFHQAAIDGVVQHGLVDDPAAPNRVRPKENATWGGAVTWLHRLAQTEGAWSATSARPAAILF